METNLSEAQSEIQKLCRKLAAEELAPHARAWDEEKVFPAEAVKKLAAHGLLGVAIPKEWGGLGLDNVAYAVSIEELSRGCAGTGVTVSVHSSLFLDPIRAFGTDEQKRRWLPPFARGEKLGCFALTEPLSGSDASEMKARARKDGDGYVIDGAKHFITNGPHADAALVFALTDPEALLRGITAFLVPIDAKGLTRSRPDNKLGIRASGSCSLIFDGVRVPAENRLGDEGDGYRIAIKALDGGRIGIAAQALGIARAAYEEAWAYAKKRHSFGKRIKEHQAIQFMLADMATELTAARLLVWHAASLKDQGARHSAESAMAKLFASEMSGRVTSHALQIFGGYGYLKEFDVERHFRDARITEIYEGTSEIQRIVISSTSLKD
jgi:butyryl-CoA dehydrogenase